MLKKTIKFSASCALIAIMTGCGSSDSGSSSKNSTQLTWNNTNTEFTINTKADNVGVSSGYYHVRHVISDSNGNALLTEGINYPGTITTTCNKELMTGTSVQYNCTTHRETSSPVGDPKDEIKTIVFYDSQQYKVFLEEMGFSADNKTEIGSIDLQ